MTTNYKLISGNVAGKSKKEREQEIVQAFVRLQTYAIRYAASNLEELQRKYGDEYLAISPGAGVIASDRDRHSLVRRLEKSRDQRDVIIDTTDNLIKLDVSRN